MQGNIHPTHIKGRVLAYLKQDTCTKARHTHTRPETERETMRGERDLESASRREGGDPGGGEGG